MEERCEWYEAEFDRHVLLDDVTVFPIVPDIMTWRLATEMERPEIYRDPEAMVMETLDRDSLPPEFLESLVRSAYMELIASRNESFGAFVDLLESIAAEASPALDAQ